LGRRETKDIDITTAVFEAIKPHLDVLVAKNLISYVVYSESPPDLGKKSSPEPTPQYGQLQQDMHGVKQSVADISAKHAESVEELAGQVDALTQKIDILRQAINVEPTPFVFRSEASNVVAQSAQSYNPVSGIQLSVPTAGRWLVLGEIGLFSPIPSKGKICLGRLGGGFMDTVLEGSERIWSRTQEDPSTVFITASAMFAAGDTLGIYWKSTEGVLRATYRSLTIIRF
jgi:hypothetical protein